jgi:hypothetical protein
MPVDSAAEDKLTPENYPEPGNQAKEKIVRVRKPAELARKLLD